MMSDQVIRRLRVNLITTMDRVLNRAVLEVMKVFENTLYDHQMEMAQKEQEIARLKLKLQLSEQKLKDLDSGDPRGVETNQAPTEPTASPAAPEDAPGDALEDAPEVSQPDHEPDDWCAPLGCELVSKEDEGVCPSVRLRAFSISLRQIPVVKHKANISDNDLQGHSHGRKSRRLSTSNYKSKRIQIRKLPVSVQENQRQPIMNDMKRSLTEFSDHNSLEGLRKKKKKRKTELSEKGPEDRVSKGRRTADGSKSSGLKSTDKKYSCVVCKKKFDTEFGRQEHELLHKTCRGCKVVFSFRSPLRLHKRSCEKFLKEAPNLPQSSQDEEC